MKYLFLLPFLLFAHTHNNNIPFREQWMSNTGYCGEVSLISAGLFYGQYLSQFTVRALSTPDGSQTHGSLLLGLNDKEVAHKMHLEAQAWDRDTEENTEQFLIWLKQKITAGYPVAIGLYLNHSLYNGSTDPYAGDPDYDHIVSVLDFSSPHPLINPTYNGTDTLGFSDNGLWLNGSSSVYYFNYALDSFPRNRPDSNAPTAPLYSLPTGGNNYGIAIVGIKDRDADTLPVRVDTDCNFEHPVIEEGSNEKPHSMLLTLTITLSQLEPNVPYILYRYNDLNTVPHFAFNAHAAQAFERWEITIPAGSTYTLQQQIQSNEAAIYRCVRANAK